MPDQDRHVIGDTELVDLVEVDAASAERPGEGPAVAVDNALSATHAHSHDVDELGVIDEQLAELVGVLRIQGRAKATTSSRGRANVAMTAEVAGAKHRAQGAGWPGCALFFDRNVLRPRRWAAADPSG